jgi:hypothetical protein
MCFRKHKLEDPKGKEKEEEEEEIRIKHSTQSQHHAEFLNVKNLVVRKVIAGLSKAITVIFTYSMYQVFSKN